MTTTWLPFTASLAPRWLLLGLCAVLTACAFPGALTTDESWLQADRERTLTQEKFRKSEINFQNQTPAP